MIAVKRKLKRFFRRTAISFLTTLRKNPQHRFAENQYYICMGTNLLSVQPYGSWKKGRAAAKRVHPKAFIMKGSTVNRYIEQAQFAGHKNAWDRYALQQPQL